MRNKVELYEKNITNLDSQTKASLAIEFSEGSEHLKSLLLLLWNNNVNTYACCAGHADESSKNGNVENLENRPYIVIDIRKMPITTLKKFIGLLCLSPEVDGMSLENDMYEEYHMAERRKLAIYLKHANSSMKCVFDAYKTANTKNNTCNFMELSSTDKDFIAIASFFKHTSIKDIDLSDYKKRYEKLPTKVDQVEAFKIGDEIHYSIELKEKRMPIMIGDELIYLTESCYINTSDGRCLVLGKNGYPEFIKKSEAEKRGLIDIDSFNELKLELFENNFDTFTMMLQSKTPKANQMQ